MVRRILAVEAVLTKTKALKVKIKHKRTFVCLIYWIYQISLLMIVICLI